MNFDDFEQRLRRLRWRSMPGEWRAEILQAARGSGAPAPAPRTAHPLRPAAPALAWWRQRLWPSPRAWAGLAAAWGFIFVLHLSSQAPTGRAVKALPALSPQVAVLLDQQRRLLAELLDLNPPEATTEPPPAAPPRPRSQRRGFWAVA